MGQQQDFGAGVGQLENGRRRGPDPRAESDTEPPFIGTLKSTRTSATLPVTSPSTIEGAEAGHPLLRPYEELRHHAGGVDHPVREAPLVVVPRNHAGELALEHRGLEAVDGRAGRLVVETDA